MGLGVFASGCATPVYVLDQTEIVKVNKGDNILCKYDGWLLSNHAVTRVMDMKIKKVNLQ